MHWQVPLRTQRCRTGPGIERAIERTGYSDFWELRNRGAIPAENRQGTVPIILAMTIMGKNAKEYGLDDVTPESAVEYETVELTAQTSLALVADLTDAPVSYLIELNPALLRNIAPSGYSLRVPKSTATALIAGLDSIPADHRTGWRMHRVETGETLAAIAKRYGATPSSIVSANHMLATDQPAPGDRLIIPAAFREPPPPKSAVRKSARMRTRTTTPHPTASVARPCGLPPKLTTVTKTAAVKPATHRLRMHKRLPGYSPRWVRWRSGAERARGPDRRQKAIAYPTIVMGVR